MIISGHRLMVGRCFWGAEFGDSTSPVQTVKRWCARMAKGAICKIVMCGFDYRHHLKE